MGRIEAMKISTVAAGLLYLLFCTAVWGGTEEDPDLVLITGEHWITASKVEKVAYLFGVGNTLEVEQAMHGKDPAEKVSKNSIVPVLINGLSHLSTKSVREMLDEWYGKNPENLKRSVIDVLYFEFALPNIESKAN